MAAAEAELPYEWKQILKSCVSEEDLQAYKNGVKMQIQMMSQFSEQIRKLEAEGTLKSCIQRAKVLIADFDAVTKNETEASKLLDLTFDHSEGNYLESRVGLCSCILENASSLRIGLYISSLRRSAGREVWDRFAMRMRRVYHMMRL